MNRKWMNAVVLRCAVLAVVFAAAGITPAVYRVSAASSKASPKAARYLYLVRHGEYDHKDPRDAEVGKALVPLGIAQARLAAARLESLPIEMTALRSSTMTRARQTALVIGESFPRLELEQSRFLIECSPRTWRKDIVSDVPPREMKECIDEMENAFAELFVPSPDFERHEIVVCHGNVIRYFVTRILGAHTKAWLNMSIGNCSLTVVRIDPNGHMELLMIGDVGHIPPNLQTGLGGPKNGLTVPGQER